MSKSLPSLKARYLTAFTVIDLLVLFCATYLATQKPSVWAWAIVIISAFLIIPAVLEQLILLAFLTTLKLEILLLKAQISKTVNFKWLAGRSFVRLTPGGLAQLQAKRLRSLVHIYQLFAWLPLGSINPYAAGLAGVLVLYSNDRCELNLGRALVSQLSLGAVSLYEESAHILERHAFAGSIDLVTIYSLLANRLLTIGNREGALVQQKRALEKLKQVKEKDLKDAASTLVLLAENMHKLDMGRDESAERLASQALAAVEQSKIGTDPKGQMELLSSALEHLSQIYVLKDRIDLATLLNTRRAAIVEALKRQELQEVQEVQDINEEQEGQELQEIAS